jgi:hypothetical protein
VEYSWARETARHVGSLVHRLLQRIAQEGPASWSDVRVQALQSYCERELSARGVPAEERTAAAARAVQALERTLVDPRGRWALSDAHREARSEWALSGMVGKQLINIVLDRSFVDDAGTRWIIDFKTGGHEGADVDDFLNREQARYAAQLERYARLVRELDRRPIRLGLYFPLLGGWREWGYKSGG